MLARATSEARLRRNHDWCVLVVDDDRATCSIVADGLSRRGFQPVCSHSPQHALEEVKKQKFDVVLSDVELGSGNGFDLCERVQAEQRDVAVVIMTAFANVASIACAIRAGAADFLVKPVSMDLVADALRHAAQRSQLRTQMERLSSDADAHRLSPVVGSSHAMLQVKRLVDRVAPGTASVLVTGESGTGKELIARALHERSGRKGNFVALNCAAVPLTLLESELFGHEQGAFTGASAASKGLFREAHGGTLFLDEIAELPLALQVKLLRALQERTVRPVGGAKEHAFDARIVTATNRDIEVEVAEKRFREDLYYRINVVRIDVPPLRARGGDVVELAQYFLSRASARSGGPPSRLSLSVAERFLSYQWLGNVRELENCVERALAMAVHDEIMPDDLPASMRKDPAPPVVDLAHPDELLSIRTVEYRYIRKVLKALGGNKTQAAQVLGFDRRTLYRKLAAFSSASFDEQAP